MVVATILPTHSHRPRKAACSLPNSQSQAHEASRPGREGIQLHEDLDKVMDRAKTPRMMVNCRYSVPARSLHRVSSRDLQRQGDGDTHPGERAEDNGEVELHGGADEPLDDEGTMRPSSALKNCCLCTARAGSSLQRWGI